MKYKFLTVLHNLHLAAVKNRGIEIFNKGRITNGPRIYQESIADPGLDVHLGFHSILEFTNDKPTYFYTFGEINEQEEQNPYNMGFQLLRKVQSFIHELWLVKDNCIYVRDGFLIIYDKKIEDAHIYRPSVSEVYNLSNGEMKETTFTDKEIQEAVYKFSNYESLSDYGGKYPDSEHLYKGNSTRMGRAIYFTSAARRSFIVEMKIVFYCTALECLFTTGTQEISHKISERVSILLGTSLESRKTLYEIVKDAYNYRSKLVHGQHIRKEKKDLKSLSSQLDNILRELISEENEVFSKSDNEIDEFFKHLIFS